MTTVEEHGSPSFVTGFGLGLLAGAAGFVLFGTKKGAAIRRDLQTAFAQAYKEEIASGQVTGEAVSLRDFLSSAFAKVKEEFELSAQETERASASRKTSAGAKRAKLSKPKAVTPKTKFKNT